MTKEKSKKIVVLALIIYIIACGLIGISSVTAQAEETKNLPQLVEEFTNSDTFNNNVKA